MELINGIKLTEMIVSGTQFLEKNKQAVNALNVFPVPDGDTGTNMSMTMVSSAREAQGVKTDHLSDIVKAVSIGALKGARGNSGVILSQILRGFAKSIQGREVMNTKDFADALEAGSEMAYKAVMKPVEGTMLTVTRVTAHEAKKIARTNTDFEEFFIKIINVAKDTLDKTPDMLDVLKEAGVVDSGGMGVLYILMGMANAISDEYIHTEISGLAGGSLPVFKEGGEALEFGYCTEFMISDLFPYVSEGDSLNLQNRLDKIGDSIVVVEDDGIIKVHVHTEMPGKILQLALRYGQLFSVKIENMREQHTQMMSMTSIKDTPIKAFGVIAVAAGDGLAEIFTDLSADYVIEGGQTMNPSTDDLLNAIDNIKAENILILPNNKNIVLVAKQAAGISDKSVYVIETGTIPQGIAAMVSFNPDAEVYVNVRNMNEAISFVKTGQVTYAVRDTTMNSHDVKEGDIIGLADKKILSKGSDPSYVAKELIEAMADDDTEIITIYYGCDVDEAEVEILAEEIEEEFPDVDVEFYCGGQPLYYYILSLE